MRRLTPVLCGFALDLLLADPDWMPHPVVYMGRAIDALEKELRSRFPHTPEGEGRAGQVLAAALPLGTLALSGGACRLARRIHPAAGFLLETVWCWQALALKGLSEESRRVYEQLEKGDLAAARKAVGRIVGRDTAELTEEEVAKAAVEFLRRGGRAAVLYAAGRRAAGPGLQGRQHNGQHGGV